MKSDLGIILMILIAIAVIVLWFTWTVIESVNMQNEKIEREK